LSFIFKIAPEADHQIRSAAAWWVKHRTKAPSALAEDLQAAFDLIEEFPYIGEPVKHFRIAGLRRILLGRIRYHLYYVASAEEQVIEVLAFWHTSRRRPPPLKTA
jgi:plasmid stabilization system protein ParE